jgi:tRNA dimethylallyltransferase
MTRPGSKRAILIAGPTASGKSGLALRVAEQFGGVVINADSMQVYRELSVLTARPTPEDEARARHALYGFVSGSEAYSAARYAADAIPAIDEARAEGRVPVVVGGTGLYFEVLLRGLSRVPPIDPDVRGYWRAQAAQMSAPELHAILVTRDPEMASRLMPTDPQRIVRALEVLESSGRSLAHWHREPGKPVLVEDETVRVLVQPDRQAHGQTIDERFDAMMRAGALEEVRALSALGLSEELPIMRTLGVAPLRAHIAGKLRLEEAMALAKAQTRQYAKRQITWNRRNMITWMTVDTQYMDRIVANHLSFIGL